MQSQITALQSELNEYEIQQRELGATLVLQDVMFEVDSATLRAGAENRLTPLINYLRRHDGVKVRIEGHTDSSGDDAYNAQLSKKRAETVAQAMINSGIARDRIETAGMGESKPIATNATTSGREENRRVEITLIES